MTNPRKDRYHLGKQLRALNSKFPGLNARYRLEKAIRADDCDKANEIVDGLMRHANLLRKVKRIFLSRFACRVAGRMNPTPFDCFFAIWFFAYQKTTPNSRKSTRWRQWMMCIKKRMCLRSACGKRKSFIWNSKRRQT